MQLHVTIPDNFLISVKEQQEDFIKNMLFNHALMLYRKNKLSLGKASELAGYNRLSFIQKLQSEDEAIYDYDAELVNEMVDNTEQVLALKSIKNLTKTGSSDAPITQSLIGILEKSALNKSDYKRHLEKKHL